MGKSEWTRAGRHVGRSCHVDARVADADDEACIVRASEAEGAVARETCLDGSTKNQLQTNLREGWWPE
jgi:hypothetical protein